MTLSIDLDRLGIRLRSLHQGNHKTICPRCSATRKHKRDPCLSVTIDAGGFAYFCHNCGFHGGYHDDDLQRAPRMARRARDFYRPG